MYETVRLTSRQIDDIAAKVAAVVCQRMRTAQELPEMVTLGEAAAILHISRDRMYRIKDRFPHVKSGDGRTGRLLFKREALLENY